MSFLQALERQQAAIFARLGEDADWEGVDLPVRVLRREADEQVGFTHGAALIDGHRLRVRKSEVDAPSEGQLVQILDDQGFSIEDGKFRVVGEPKLDRRRVWTCIVEPVA
jgi:hypothetical protein